MCASQTATDVFEAHEIRGPESCIAWGYEFIAKWHETLALDQFPIQTEHPSGMGFSAENRAWFKDKFGISTEERHVPIDQLPELIEEQLEKNNPPVIRMFSRAEVEYRSDDNGIVKGIGIGRSYHAFVGYRQDGKNFLVGRIFRHPKPIFLLWNAVRELDRLSEVLKTGYAPVACLLHSSPSPQRTNLSDALP